MVAMLMLLVIWSELLKLKQRVRAFDSSVKFRKLMRAYRAIFDPDQPCDEVRRWTDGGHIAKNGGGYGIDSLGGEGNGLSSAPRLDVYAARRCGSLAVPSLRY